jgi:hypothetical protein
LRRMMRFRRLSRFLGHVPRKHLNEITISRACGHSIL